ncbi:lytic transglycosylase domain-containing protein [Tunicatimonas pelagia]|uniref:lytic transglycosylase domain-containing protein n=1 Tax=Tunicatimonas pelagia TaxID=931531 RepID=UPI002665E20B|nr:lytic transglycosylase domain-containing protein [Tunicatimonas pelagia]WKN42471.1 transglycosylase SLT domain-containing protein [Tunicatimonas pelagia]
MTLPTIEAVEVHQANLQSMKRDWNGQLAFQTDQLNTLLSPPTSAISNIKVPDFTAEELDKAVNRLLVIPPPASASPYGFAANDLVDYPDAVYQQRFRQISTDIPLVFNNQVKTFIEVYAIRKRDLTQRMLGKSVLYYPYIEQVLAEHDLPDELKHLVMVESALETEAASARAAAGLWQIRPITGRGLGLTINRTIDQRLDPYASTQAAVRYLKKLHDMYGDWLMAIAAYNCGPGNMHKAIVRAGGSKNFWRVQRFLPRETRSYVPAFMALVYLNEFQQEHNLRPVYPALSFQTVDTVRIYREITLEKIAASTVVALEELQFLNPALVQNKIPFWRGGYPLVLPLDKIARFEQKRNYLLVPVDYSAQIAKTARITKQRRAVVPEGSNYTKLLYRVRRGNTMVNIARRYGCSVKDIQDWNAKSDHIIRVGEELTLYIAKSKTSP